MSTLGIKYIIDILKIILIVVFVIFGLIVWEDIFRALCVKQNTGRVEEIPYHDLTLQDSGEHEELGVGEVE